MDPDRPGEELLPLMRKLEECLTLEPKFQPHLELPESSNDTSEITAGIRDGSAHVLRCLKVWYDLPSDVLFVAINLMDRFLTRMKVSCWALNLAAQQVAAAARPDEIVEIPDPTDLASISQCKCTLGDLTRMGGIISLKLGAAPNTLPVTSLTFIRLLHSIFTVAARESGLGDVYEQVVSGPGLLIQLEIIACDVTCSNYRPIEIALVLFCAQLHIAASEYPEFSRLVRFALELRKICQIPDENFFSCHETVLNILARYNAQTQMPYRQRLVWRLSQRTMRLLRPTDKLVNTLPTIDEHGQLQLPLRPRSSSLSSEESWESNEDWPSSAMESVAEEDEEEPPSTFHCDLA
ncbi:UNVERIFIED_CONTAM: hypothetical protein PYX00_003322 [Menopon gallinae]|uniref:Cyclin N-terminal domain-containing protein n=1 Tax=Menopon gallinae TaxID=328185 RepID=A0AAW2I0Q9_9NEOP